MRKPWVYMLLMLVLSWPFNGQAQAVSYRKEKITVNGRLYAYLEKGGSVWNRDYTLRNRQHMDLANARAISTQLADGLEYTYYEISFVGFEDKAEMEDSYDFGRRLAREFVAFNLLQLDTLNPDGVNRFVAKYPPRISQRLRDIPPPYQPEQDHRREKLPGDYQDAEEGSFGPLKGAGNNNHLPDPGNSKFTAEPKTVGYLLEKPGLQTEAAVGKTSIDGKSRKALKVISIRENEILKGGKSVGRFAEMEKTARGKLVKHFAFFNLGTIEVATATQTPQDSFSYQVYSAKDHKTRTLKVKSDQDALQFLAEWLAKNRYL